MGYYVDVGELDRNQRPILESQKRKAEIFADVSSCARVYSALFQVTILSFVIA